MCEYWGRGLNCVGPQLCLLQCRGFFGTCIPNFSQTRNLLKWFTMKILLLVITIILPWSLVTRQKFFHLLGTIIRKENNYPKRVSCFLRKFRSKLSLQAHRKTIFVSNVSRNFKKKVASVTFKVYRGIFSWNGSAVTEFCIVNFHIGSCCIYYTKRI